MEIFISNIYSVLKTSNVRVLRALGKKYSALAPGYQYTPSYRRRVWDGKKNFFSSKSGKFGTGLLPYILEDLDYIEADYKLIDKRKPKKLESPEVEGIEFRRYQEFLVSKILKTKNGIIKAPTGAGKTIILAGILNALKGRTGLIFFNKKQLLHQTYKFLISHGIECGVAFGDGVDIKPLTLCTIQSLDKVIDSHVMASEFIIFDEIHEFAKGKVAGKVLKSFPNATYRIGMTATPPTDNFSKMSLESFLGPVIEYVTAEDLINDGFLTKPEIQLIDLPDEDLDEWDGKSYLEVYEDYIINNECRNNIIASIANGLKDEKSRMLIITKNLKHAEILHKLIPGSYKLEGKDSLLDREKSLSDFVNSKGPSVMIGTIIFQTGVDIPELTHLINARGLKSEIATIQAIGRALRTHKNKTTAYIYDFIDKAPYVSKHSAKRIAAYKSLNFNINDGKKKRKRKED